ncbi:MAG: hypothetical protein ACOCQ3_03695 [Natronomonas sp.]
MNRSMETFVAVVLLYAVVSFAVGIVSYVVGSWAQPHFLLDAAGDPIDTPGLAGLVRFQIVAGTLLLMPLFGGVVGLVAGSWFYDITPAIGVSAGGVFLGSVFFALAAIGLGSIGSGVNPIFSTMLLGGIVVSAFFSAIAAGLGAAIGTAQH